MAFRGWSNQHLARFNSADSSEFLDLYEDARDAKILSAYDEPSHKTFAPSSFRCKRIQWFRLRGVQPDKPKTADAVLDFTAVLGTALHKMIQETLKESLGESWIDVEEYIKDNLETSENYMSFQKGSSGHEWSCIKSNLMGSDIAGCTKLVIKVKGTVGENILVKIIKACKGNKNYESFSA